MRTLRQNPRRQARGNAIYYSNGEEMERVMHEEVEKVPRMVKGPYWLEARS